MTTDDKTIIAVADQILSASAFGLPHFTPQECRREKEFLINACRGARRFFLDDDVTAAASSLGQLHPEILKEALRRARTPFRRVLIDYSPKASVEAGGGVVMTNVPPRSAVLIEHIDGSRYRMTPIGALDVKGGKRMAFVQAVSIIYDLEMPIGPHPDQDMLVDVWSKSAQQRGVRIVTPNGKMDFAHVEFSREHATTMVRSCLFGGGRDIKRDDAFGTRVMINAELRNKTRIGGVIDAGRAGPMQGDYKVIVGEPLDPQENEEEETRRQQVLAFKSHASHQFTPCNAPAYRRLLREQFERDAGYDGGSIGDIVAEAINEFSGQWRFIVCALYLLNGQDFVGDTSWKTGSAPRMIRGKIVPYLEHRRVSLKVPRLVVVRKATKTLGEAIPRRRHEVGGHWAHRRGKGDPSCEHVWVKMSEHREQCALCEYDRWWIRDHERGDASLGYVTKDRVVEKR